MAKWQPPHPAREIKTPRRCKLGQRFSSMSGVMSVTCGPLGPLAVKLKLVTCSWCQGGYHLVTEEELSRYRKVLTEVPHRD